MLIPQSTLLGLGSPIFPINSVLSLPPAALDPVSHSGAVFWTCVSQAQQAAEVACGSLGSSTYIFLFLQFPHSSGFGSQVNSQTCSAVQDPL